MTRRATNYRIAWAARLSLLLPLSLVACGQPAQECSIGSEGCVCTAGSACDQGLVCLSGLCVRFQDGDQDATVVLDMDPLDDAAVGQDAEPSQDGDGASEPRFEDLSPSDTGLSQVDRGDQEATCGDGTLQIWEDCDPSVVLEAECYSLGAPFLSGAATCTAACRVDTTACTRDELCGNRRLDGDEECDDGNITTGDGCSGRCAQEGESFDEFEVNDAQLLHDPWLGDVETALPESSCILRALPEYPPGAALRVRVQFYHVISSDDEPADPDFSVDKWLGIGNAFLQGTGLTLISGGDVVEIEDPEGRFFDISTTQRWRLFQQASNDSAVDVFLVNSLVNQHEESLCGVANDIGLGRRYDSAIVAAHCEKSTLAHELGHLFGLWHTHHTRIGDTCWEQGDALCDTAPDPGRDVCDATTSCTISCCQGESPSEECEIYDPSYPPDPSNVMSYHSCARRVAEASFSLQQVSRMLCHLDMQYEHAVSSGATVSGVTPSSATLGERTRFDVAGNGLAPTTTAWIGECLDLEVIELSPDAFVFSCIPGGEAGAHEGRIAAAPDGESLFEFSIEFVEDCIAQDAQDCWDGDVYWVDSCGTRGDRARRCLEGQRCLDNGATATCETVSCAPDIARDHQDCSGGHPYWYDDCDERGSQVEACAACESCVDNGDTASCDATTTNDHQDCSGGHPYWYDSCGGQGARADTCTAEEVCQDAGASASCVVQGCVATVANDHQNCSGGHPYWYDDCEERGSRVETCAACESCQDSGATASCEPDASNDHQDCSGGHPYWYDSCGSRGTRVDTCASCETCTDVGATASCEPDTSNDHQDCSGGHPYWYDSCGSRGTRVDTCGTGETCEDQGATASCESSCGESNYWSPASMNATDPEGVGDEMVPVPVGLRAEFSAGSLNTNIRIRICRTDGEDLKNNLYVYFEEWATATGRVMFDGILPTSNSCTAWGNLSNESSYDPGDKIGGQIRVVSGDNCDDKWARWCSDDPDPGCGSCWHINTSTLERTCRE